MAKKPENSGRTGKRKPPPPPEGDRFKPGQSGNPGGRPKIVQEFRKACQDMWPQVLATWSEILLNTRADPHARNRAGENIAAYAFGKPPQTIEDASGAALTLLDVIKRASGASDEKDGD